MSPSFRSYSFTMAARPVLLGMGRLRLAELTGLFLAEDEEEITWSDFCLLLVSLLSVSISVSPTSSSSSPSLALLLPLSCPPVDPGWPACLA